ncbi:hypothetical protein LJB83_00750 [Clostridia bacterium OttesenSCG-928-F22]|nr:hypothetical protein [Clostridia bacterium OttesenSCG-928-F22]
MQKWTLQIQSVIYHNWQKDLYRNLESIQLAYRANKSSGGPVDKIIFRYGDASKEPVFNEQEVAALKQQFAEDIEIHYEFFGFNSGTAKGHNLLGKQCTADYMMIMNPDVLLQSNFFTEIFRPFQNETLKAGIAEARQTPVEHPKRYNFETGETSWAATASAVFPTSLFNQLDGFDEETFFMYCDDVDFSWRARLLGYQVIYCPAAVIFHAKRIRAKGGVQSTEAERYYSAEAALLMAYKFSNPSELDKLMGMFSMGDNRYALKALNEFKRRQQNGSLPEQLDAEHKVAQFIDGYYSRNRYSL